MNARQPEDPLSVRLRRVDALLLRGVLRQRARPSVHAKGRFWGQVISDDEVDALLVAHGELDAEPVATPLGVERALADSQRWRDAPLPGDRLTHLRDTFGLHADEVDVLLLALAPEVAGGHARLFAYLHDALSADRLTVDLAARLIHPDRTRRLGLVRRLLDGPLSAHRLIDLHGDGPLAGRAITLTQGLLAWWLRDEPPPAPRPPGVDAPRGVVRLAGPERAAHAWIAAVADGVGRPLHALDPDDPDPAARVREARLDDAVVWLPGAVDLDRWTGLAALPGPVGVCAEAHGRAADALPEHVVPPVPARGRPHLGPLATCRRPRRTWDDLVLPEPLHARLTRLAARAASPPPAWGGALNTAQPGLRLLLAGPPGTGKTLAAEVLAHALDLDLARVDLSAVVSKWIGETSKHLHALFDAAEGGRVLLLFDEGDALFGARQTEGGGSQARYANQEVAYLLQRLEAFTGVAVVTTNLLDQVDPAFRRRFTDVLAVPFPDAATRARLWAHALPDAGHRTADVDAARLGHQVVLAGAGIASAVRAGCADAHAADRPVGLADLARAAADELRKLGEPLTPTTLGDLLPLSRA